MTSTSKYKNIQVQLSNQYLKLRSFQHNEQQDAGAQRLIKDIDQHLNSLHRTTNGGHNRSSELSTSGKEAISSPIKGQSTK